MHVNQEKHFFVARRCSVSTASISARHTCSLRRKFETAQSTNGFHGAGLTTRLTLINSNGGPPVSRSVTLPKTLRFVTLFCCSSTSLPNDSCSKIALNICGETASRWKRNCPSLSSTDLEVILWPKSFNNCTAVSLTGPRVSKAIDWNTYDPDNAAHFFFWTPPSQLLCRLRMHTRICMYESANVVATVTDLCACVLLSMHKMFAFATVYRGRG